MFTSQGTGNMSATAPCCDMQDTQLKVVRNLLSGLPHNPMLSPSDKNEELLTLLLGMTEFSKVASSCLIQDAPQLS